MQSITTHSSAQFLQSRHKEIYHSWNVYLYILINFFHYYPKIPWKPIKTLPPLQPMKTERFWCTWKSPFSGDSLTDLREGDSHPSMLSLAKRSHWRSRYFPEAIAHDCLLRGAFPHRSPWPSNHWIICRDLFLRVGSLGEKSHFWKLVPELFSISLIINPWRSVKLMYLVA